MTARLAKTPATARDWCGDVLDGHGRQWHPVAGFHGWEPLRVDDPTSPRGATHHLMALLIARGGAA